MLTRLSCLIVLAALAAAGCGETNPTGGTRANNATPASVNFMVATMPDGAVALAAAKETAREGERIVARGRVGGSRDPFTAGAAVFTIMDSKLPSCADRHGDDCPTPWDYCCETPDSKISNSATVQVVDASGTLLTVDMTKHLKPLDEIIVVGTVAPRPDQKVLVIKAEKIHVVKG